MSTLLGLLGAGSGGGGGAIPINGILPLNVGTSILYTATDNTEWLKTGNIILGSSNYPNALQTLYSTNRVTPSTVITGVTGSAAGESWIVFSNNGLKATLARRGTPNSTITEYILTEPYNILGPKIALLYTFETNMMQGIGFADNGSKFYVLFWDTNESVFAILYYNLNIPYDLASRTTIGGFSYLSNSGISNATGFLIRNNGTRIWFVGNDVNGANRIWQFNLTTAFNTGSLGAATTMEPTRGYNSIGLNPSEDKLAIAHSSSHLATYTLPTSGTITGALINNSGIFIPGDGRTWNNSGTELTTLNFGNVRKYTSTIPYDYGGITENNTLYTAFVSGITTIVKGIHFGDNGSKFYIVTSDTIYYFTTTTPYYFSGATFISSLNISAKTTNIYRIFLSYDGMHLYIGDVSGGYQYVILTIMDFLGYENVDIEEEGD
jgi:hypothetical protein